MDIDEKIRLRIREEMKRQSITQAELARRMGIKPPSLSQVLNGERGMLPTSLINVLTALGLTVEALRVESSLTDVQSENG